MPPIFAAGLILLFGSFIQGTIGFALGLIAVPLLLNAGFSLSQAVSLTILCIGIQVFFGVIRLRHHIPRQDIKLAVLMRYATMPLGVLLLLSVESMDTEQVKQFVGFAVLFGVILRLLPTKQEHRELPLGVSIATFGISGILQGLVAMGGPPVVLWVTTRDYTAKQSRSFLMTLSLLNAPAQVLLLLLVSQTMSLEVLAMAFLFVPVIFIGTMIGVWVGNHFSKHFLNNIAMAVLVVIALNAIF